MGNCFYGSYKKQGKKVSLVSPASPLSSRLNGPVGVRCSRGGYAVTEPHTYACASLQERHQGRCGEGGKTLILEE